MSSTGWPDAALCLLRMLTFNINGTRRFCHHFGLNLLIRRMAQVFRQGRIMTHDFGINVHLIILRVCSRSTTIIFHSFQFFWSGLIWNLSSPRYHAATKFRLLTNTKDKIDVATQKTGANETSHTEIISDWKDSPSDCNFKSCAMDNDWRNLYKICVGIPHRNDLVVLVQESCQHRGNGTQLVIFYTDPMSRMTVMTCVNLGVVPLEADTM